jgi:uncharacterized protein (DUF1015 family)
MACLIPDSGILIHAFHRYLNNLDMPNDEFITRLSEKFEVEEVGESNISTAPGVIFCYMASRWFRIQIPGSLKQSGNHCENLDVFIMDKYIFGEILNIRNTRSSNRVEYVSGLMPAESLVFPVDQGDEEALFLLHPVKAAAVMQVSDHNETMPPKSTWIEPKLRSGLLIHELKK